MHLPLVLSLADAVAALHGAAESAGRDTDYGRAAEVQQQSDDNFRELGERLSDNRDRARLAALDAWTGSRFEAIENVIEARRACGRVRECHGDLHLGNILLEDGRCVLFDCIEFNAALRWTDTAADIAFTMMDIAHAVDRALANLLYNEYLQCTGDYDSVAIIDYFLVYRALVRAKVDAIRRGQSGDRGDAAGPVAAT
ncbi:MAG: phosphotransferase [Halioglobus sp.]|nr:phosphotransferase [Halioglobus sp.]